MNGLPNRRKLRIHVIEEVEQDGFRYCWFYRRSESFLAVMTEYDVFQLCEEWGGKSLHLGCVLPENSQTDRDVAYQSAFIRVRASK
jgi:hypothetical protein